MPLLGREWIRQLHLLEFSSSVQINTLVTPTNCDKVRDARVQNLLEKYKSISELGLTKITELQAKLTLKTGAKPVFIKARPLPFKVKPLVEAELDNLEKEGILVKTSTSEWATPIVPVLKSNNTVRICGDFKITLNPQLQIDDHPLPTVDELFATMAGGQKFSKIDFQMEVTTENQPLLTINTHKVLYQCTRLLYGVASTPAILWQREMENILTGIPDISIFLDDIRVTGPNNETQLQRLE